MRDGINNCDVVGCGGWKRHGVRFGSYMTVGVCDQCHEMVYALGKRYDREFLDLEAKYFELFKGLRPEKGEGDENPNV